MQSIAKILLLRLILKYKTVLNNLDFPLLYLKFDQYSGFKFSVRKCQTSAKYFSMMFSRKVVGVVFKEITINIEGISMTCF